MNSRNHIHSPEFAGQNCYDAIKTLRHFIDGSAEIWIKYTYYLKVDRNEFLEEKTWIDGYPGSVRLMSFSPNQRFYGNLRMVECDPNRLSVLRSGGQRIIQVRDILFIEAQLYLKSASRVLKLEQDKGFLAIRIPDTGYRSVIKQLKD